MTDPKIERRIKTILKIADQYCFAGAIGSSTEEEEQEAKKRLRRYLNRIIEQERREVVKLYTGRK